MPATISCPECHRALALPAEAMNRIVQCPACKHAFHPAAAEAAVQRRATPAEFAAPSEPPAAAPRSSDRPGPPPPRINDDAPPPRRTRRRREEYDICPKCDARMARGEERCPECGVQFETEADDRPWERNGAERRDSEPGRGGMILTMGIGSICVPVFFFCPIAGLVGSLLGLGLGVAAWIMGHNDLRKIDQHIMAREARGSTHGGMVCGIVGTILSFIGILVAAFITYNALM